MKIAKWIAWLGLVAMTAVLVKGFVNGNFSRDGAELLANPWGIVSFIDLYVGFALFSIWIAYREESVLAKIIWILLMMVLGFFTGSLYVLIALYQSKGRWLTFFLGEKKANSIKEKV